MEGARLGCVLDSLDIHRAQINDLAAKQAHLYMEFLSRIRSVADVPFPVPSAKRRKGSARYLDTSEKENCFKVSGNGDWFTVANNMRDLHLSSTTKQTEFIPAWRQPLVDANVIYSSGNWDSSTCTRKADEEDLDKVVMPQQGKEENPNHSFMKKAQGGIPISDDALYTSSLEPSPLVVEPSHTVEKNEGPAQEKSCKRGSEPVTPAVSVSASMVTRSRAKIPDSVGGSTSNGEEEPPPKMCSSSGKLDSTTRSSKADGGVVDEILMLQQGKEQTLNHSFGKKAQESISVPDAPLHTSSGNPPMLLGEPSQIVEKNDIPAQRKSHKRGADHATLAAPVSTARITRSRAKILGEHTTTGEGEPPLKKVRARKRNATVVSSSVVETDGDAGKPEKLVTRTVDVLSVMQEQDKMELARLENVETILAHSSLEHISEVPPCKKPRASKENARTNAHSPAASDGNENKSEAAMDVVSSVEEPNLCEKGKLEKLGTISPLIGEETQASRKSRTSKGNNGANSSSAAEPGETAGEKLALVGDSVNVFSSSEDQYRKGTLNLEKEEANLHHTADELYFVEEHSREEPASKKSNARKDVALLSNSLMGTEEFMGEGDNVLAHDIDVHIPLEEQNRKTASAREANANSTSSSLVQTVAIVTSSADVLRVADEQHGISASESNKEMSLVLSGNSLEVRLRHSAAKDTRVEIVDDDGSNVSRSIEKGKIHGRTEPAVEGFVGPTTHRRKFPGHQLPDEDVVCTDCEFSPVRKYEDPVQRTPEKYGEELLEHEANTSFELRVQETGFLPQMSVKKCVGHKDRPYLRISRVYEGDGNATAISNSPREMSQNVGETATIMNNVDEDSAAVQGRNQIVTPGGVKATIIDEGDLHSSVEKSVRAQTIEMSATVPLVLGDNLLDARLSCSFPDRDSGIVSGGVAQGEVQDSPKASSCLKGVELSWRKFLSDHICCEEISDTECVQNPAKKFEQWTGPTTATPIHHVNLGEQGARTIVPDSPLLNIHMRNYCLENAAEETIAQGSAPKRLREHDGNAGADSKSVEQREQKLQRGEEAVAHTLDADPSVVSNHRNVTSGNVKDIETDMACSVNVQSSAEKQLTRVVERQTCRAFSGGEDLEVGVLRSSSVSASVNFKDHDNDKIKFLSSVDQEDPQGITDSSLKFLEDVKLSVGTFLQGQLYDKEGCAPSPFRTDEEIKQITTPPQGNGEKVLQKEGETNVTGSTDQELGETNHVMENVVEEHMGDETDIYPTPVAVYLRPSMHLGDNQAMEESGQFDYARLNASVGCRSESRVERLMSRKQGILSGFDEAFVDPGDVENDDALELEPADSIMSRHLHKRDCGWDDIRTQLESKYTEYDILADVLVAEKLCPKPVRILDGLDCLEGDRPQYEGNQFLHQEFRRNQGCSMTLSEPLAANESCIPDAQHDEKEDISLDLRTGESQGRYCSLAQDVPQQQPLEGTHNSLNKLWFSKGIASVKESPTNAPFSSSRILSLTKESPQIVSNVLPESRPRVSSSCHVPGVQVSQVDCIADLQPHRVTSCILSQELKTRECSSLIIQECSMEEAVSPLGTPQIAASLNVGTNVDEVSSKSVQGVRDKSSCCIPVVWRMSKPNSDSDYQASTLSVEDANTIMSTSISSMKKGQGVSSSSRWFQEGDGSALGRSVTPMRLVNLLQGGTSSKMANPHIQASNLVSKMKTFVPVIPRPLPTFLPSGKREIKVKALEAAEISRRMEEKREAERRDKLMRKVQDNARCAAEKEREKEEVTRVQMDSVEVSKLGAETVKDSRGVLSDCSNSKPLCIADANLKRTLASKLRTEQVKMKKFELEVKREEERKRKEEKLLARREKREELEKKEREEKRKRQEDLLKQRKEQEHRLRVEVEEKEQRQRAIEEAERQKKAKQHAEKEKEREHRQKEELEAKAAEKEAENKSREEAILFQKSVEEKEQKTAEGQQWRSVPGDICTPNVLGEGGKDGKSESGVSCLEMPSLGAAEMKDTGPTSYEISPYKPSDDEDEEEHKRPSKHIPFWARKENLKPQLLKQLMQDPDEIFSGLKTCSLKEVFGTNGSKKIQDFGKRSGSGDWVKDRVSWKEELQYKINMGYMRKNP